MRRTLAHILPWPNVGGTEHATLRLADAAAQAGFDNLFYVPDLPGAGEVEALVREAGHAPRRYRQVAPRRSNPLPYLGNVARLAADFARSKVSVVHGADIAAAYFTAAAARLAGATASCHVRCGHPRLTGTERLLLRPVERFVFVSRATWGEQDFPCPAERGEVLYDAAVPPAHRVSRAEARAHYGLPDDALVFGMAARVNDQKDHASVIRAVGLTATDLPQARFLMAGDHAADPVHRATFTRLAALMDETGTRERVRFCGFEGDMARFYAAIDVFVLATHTEGFPLVILEAMGAGRPVVASNVGGVPEAVTPDVGFLVPDGDPQALAEAFRTLAGSAGLLTSLGEAAARRARTVFGPERFTREAGALFQRLAGM